MFWVVLHLYVLILNCIIKNKYNIYKIVNMIKHIDKYKLKYFFFNGHISLLLFCRIKKSCQLWQKHSYHEKTQFS